MSKSSGGVRKNGREAAKRKTLKGKREEQTSQAQKSAQTESYKIAPLRESEKAIQVQLTIDVSYAPSSGYTSSLVKDKTITENVWIPKSQIENNNLSEWIAKSKTQELLDRKLGSGVHVIRTNNLFLDANRREIAVAKNARERAFAEGRRAKVSAEREELMRKAKANGHTVRQNLKTSTLREMASTKAAPRTASSFPSKNNIVSALARRGVSTSQAWKIVKEKYATIYAQHNGIGKTKDLVDLFL